MRKILLLLFILLISINVCATTGSINKDTIIKCDKNYYGMHSNHYHEVYKKDSKWIIKNDKEVTPSCLNQIKKEEQKIEFDRCVDGDTFKVFLNGKNETVRLIGVNTPESVKPNEEVEYYGKESSEYTCDLLTNAKEITFEYDTKCDERDKYDRILAYVYLDGVMLNKEIIKNGYGEVKYIYDDYFYTTQLYELQDEAKSLNLGVWGEETKEGIEPIEKKSFFDIIIDFFINLFKSIFE